MDNIFEEGSTLDYYTIDIAVLTLVELMKG
jgi:hypothetical protein